MQIEPELTPDLYERARESEYHALACNVIHDAVHGLKLAESWVAREASRLRRMPVHEHDRHKIWQQTWLVAKRITDQIRRDLDWFSTPNYAMWSHFLESDPDTKAREYQRRAGNLLREIQELTRGAV